MVRFICFFSHLFVPFLYHYCLLNFVNSKCNYLMHNIISHKNLVALLKCVSLHPNQVTVCHQSSDGDASGQAVVDYLVGCFLCA